MQKSFRTALATAAVAALTGGLMTAVAAPATAAPAGGAHADFNGDGISDVAFSAGDATVSGHAYAGQIVALYGSANGLSATRRKTVSQNTTGVPGTSEYGDQFGWSSAAGDFDGDGYSDLAVGADLEDVGSDKDGGTVAILWGSSSGLTGGTTLADPAPTSHDYWGKILVAGDFDGDGTTDLGVSSSTSTVYVFKQGLTRSGTAGARQAVKAPIQSGGDAGPLNLTSGDVDHDGRADLVVDGYETDSEQGWNANYYVPGSAAGLVSADAVKLAPGIITGVGDVNGDGFGDVVTGSAWDASSGVPQSQTGGTVHVTYGTADGPGSEKSFSQNTGNVPGASESGDWFGAELSLGDVNGDGFQDVAVGASGENLTVDGTNRVDTGAVTVLYGSASGLNTTSGTQFFSQDTAGVPGSAESYDRFGGEVKLEDVTGDGKADLSIGAFGENGGTKDHGGNGAVTFLKSDGTRISTTGAGSISTTAAAVSTSGYPMFGANAAN